MNETAAGMPLTTNIMLKYQVRKYALLLQNISGTLKCGRIREVPNTEAKSTNNAYSARDVIGRESCLFEKAYCSNLAL